MPIYTIKLDDFHVDSGATTVSETATTTMKISASGTAPDPAKFDFWASTTIKTTGSALPIEDYVTALCSIIPDAQSANANIFIASIPDLQTRISFNLGGHATVVGEVVNDGASASGTVQQVVVQTGSWATLDAAGYIDVNNVTGTWGGTGPIKDSVATTIAAVTGSTVFDTGLNPLIKSARVTRNLTDRMARGTFEFNRTNVGGFLNTNYFKNIEFKMPDHTGLAHTIMLGFFPSSTANYGVASQYESLTAYDYAWYLTMQYLDTRDMVLLPIADQSAGGVLYRLNYDYCTDPYLNFEKGQVVMGATTLDYGTVSENHFSGSYGRGYLILEDVHGTPVSGHYFQDNENLQVGAQVYGAADGYTMDVSGYFTYTYPDDWVKHILGGYPYGDDWLKTTGIYPGYLTSTGTVWGGTKPQVPFTFGEKTTKMQAIEELSKYLEWIFIVKWKSVGGVMTPCAFWDGYANIDAVGNPFNIPAPVAVTYPDPYLVDPITLDQKGEEKYNRVTVRCQDFDGNWFSKTIQTPGVIAGDDKPIEYYEINPDIASQAECDARATILYDYYSNHVSTWTAKFNRRCDFEILQLLTFSGYSTMIPNGNYRIIGIEYYYDNGGITNQVTCTLVPDAQFKAYMDLNRFFTDSIKNMQSVVKSELDKMGIIGDVGSVTAITGKRVTVESERGLTKVVRDAS
jgi:hypothetical protein